MSSTNSDTPAVNYELLKSPDIEEGSAESEHKQSEHEHTHSDYVIVVSKSTGDKIVVNLLKENIKKLGLNLRTVDSTEYIDLELVYILVEAPREVLTARAECNRTSVPIRQILVKDMMHDTTKDDRCLNPNRISHQRRTISRLSRGSQVWRFIRDWFRPTLVSGYIKFDYELKYDGLFTSDPSRDPFVKHTRIRCNLVHDMIKDIDITADLKEVKHSEVENGFGTTISEYRGLEWMKNKGYVKKSFVPHCREDRERCKNLRNEKGCWIQSVTSIREYLGEKVGFSFAWRSAWLSCGLTIPSILGIFVTLYGAIAKVSRQSKTHGLAYNDLDGNYTNVKNLSSNHLFDNEALPFYAILTLLLQINLFTFGWARYKFVYGFKWGVLNYFLINERQIVKNCSLKDLTKDRKFRSKVMSLFLGTTALVMVIFYNLIVFFIQQIFKAFLVFKLNRSDTEAFYYSIVSLSFLNTIVVILVLNRLFAKFAKYLCDKEYHTFHSDYERSLTWKIFFYSFIANTLRLFMMLVAPRIELPFRIPSITPNNENFVIEFCEEGKCLATVTVQLIFFLFAKPLAGLGGYFKDNAIYYIKKQASNLMCMCQETRGKRKSRTLSTDSAYLDEVKRLDRDYRLYESDRFGERYQTLMDMNDRVAQYAFVIMFGGTCPLSPLIAFVMEIFLKYADIHRYTKNQRRPVPRRHEGVGCWEEIVELVNVLAIFTNVWIVAYRSTYISQFEVPKLGFLLMGLIPAVVYAIRAVTQVTSIPEKVKRFQREEADAAEEFLKSFTDTGNRHF